MTTVDQTDDRAQMALPPVLGEPPVIENQEKEVPSLDLRQTYIPVRADCGHIFPVSVLRLVDGAEFVCPQCGVTDRIEDQALADARAQLDGRKEEDGRNPLDVLVRAALLARDGKSRAE